MMVDHHGPKILSHHLIHAFTFLHRNPALEEVVLFVWTQTQLGVMMEGPWQRRCLKHPETGLRLMRLMTPYFNNRVRKRDINSQGGHVLKKHMKNNTTSAIDFSRFLRWSDAQQTCAAEQKDLRHSNTTLCDEENHDLLTAISSRWLASRSTVNKPLESTR